MRKDNSVAGKGSLPSHGAGEIEIAGDGVIVVVTGLPRSGTSMMMKMLAAGGIPILTDGIRAADADNQAGYFELEVVKRIESDAGWLMEARGKAIKVVSPLLERMPRCFRYSAVVMHRDITEILASQRKMMSQQGHAPDDVPPEKMAAVFVDHLRAIERWLARQPHFTAISMNYNRLLVSPGPELARLNHYLGGGLKIEAMRDVIDPDLYHQRAR